MQALSADRERLPGVPDLRLADVRTRIIRAVAPFDLPVHEPSRGLFAFVLQGALVLRLKDAEVAPIPAPAGTGAGFEGGRAHRWSSAAEYDGPIELFITSVPRKMGVLQGLENGMILVPSTAEPTARLLRRAVELHLAEFEAAETMDGSIIRRCAEICMMQIVRHAHARGGAAHSAPARLAHDENLLRAWSAYWAAPARRWNLALLAEAAGLGRTAFITRFRTAFGTPPLQTLRALRLEHARAMLRAGRAPLIEIAVASGYNSEAAFIRAFHRQFGDSPGRLRGQSMA